MKRAAALALVLVALLCGCTQNAMEANINRRIQDWRPESHAGPSDIVEYTDGNFHEKLGFDVVGYPNTTDYPPQKFFSVDTWFGQIEYRTQDGRLLVLRMAKDTSSDLATSYAERHNQDVSTRQLGDVAITTAKAEKGCVMSSWEKSGFQYILHSNEKYAAPSEEEVDLFVQQLDCHNIVVENG